MDYHRVDNWTKHAELKKLLELSTPPKNIFYVGKWNRQIFTNCVAVVGSRKITSYGQRVIEKLIPALVAQGLTIVSGFMYGVDQYVHQICLQSGGKTIAVLGWGINTKLSGYDLSLAKKIVESGGLLISEWEEQKPSHWTFPSRNRIVAALSDQVYIVEAAINSGSLITARLATTLKKQLWAVPGPITSKTSMGTNKLIAEGKAKIWLGENQLNLPQLKTNDPILQILDNEALAADEIAIKLKQPIAKIGAQLSILQLSGQIAEEGGKYFIADVS